MSRSFYPTVFGVSLYGDFEEAVSRAFSVVIVKQLYYSTLSYFLENLLRKATLVP